MKIKLKCAICIMGMAFFNHRIVKSWRNEDYLECDKCVYDDKTKYLIKKKIREGKYEIA